MLQTLKPFLNDPYYQKIDDDDINFILAYYNARSSVAELPLHIDNYFPTGGDHPNSMQIVFSLSGQDAQNGATVVVPGSHRIQNFPDRSISQISQVVNCEPGDVIVWDSRLWHGALENKTGQDRWSLVATFRPWFMKQNFDVVRGLSESIFQLSTPQEKALLGFLSLPVVDETERINLKQGYSDLKTELNEYRERGRR